MRQAHVKGIEYPTATPASKRVAPPPPPPLRMKAYKGALTQRLWNLMRDASLSAPHVTVEGDGCFYFPLGTATWACSRGEAVTLIVARSMAGALSSLLEEQVEIHGLTEAGDGRMLTLPLRGVEVLDDGRMRVVVATREQVLFALRYPLS